MSSRCGCFGIEVGHDAGAQQPFIGAAGPTVFLFGEIYMRGVPIYPQYHLSRHGPAMQIVTGGQPHEEGRGIDVEL